MLMDACVLLFVSFSNINVIFIFIQVFISPRLSQRNKISTLEHSHFLNNTILKKPFECHRDFNCHKKSFICLGYIYLVTFIDVFFPLSRIEKNKVFGLFSASN